VRDQSDHDGGWGKGSHEPCSSGVLHPGTDVGNDRRQPKRAEKRVPKGFPRRSGINTRPFRLTSSHETTHSPPLDRPCGPQRG
jgi:hypothetical protein